MNWGKAILAGAIGGFVVNIYDFIMHGFIMGDTYREYSTVFSQEQASPLWFFLISILIGVAGGLLFGRTRSAWGPGVMAGVKFGAFVGLISFFAQFYNSLVIQDFPYFLSWCWGGISFIGWLVFGAIAAVIYKEPVVP